MKTLARLTAALALAAFLLTLAGCAPQPSAQTGATGAAPTATIAPSGAKPGAVQPPAGAHVTATQSATEAIRAAQSADAKKLGGSNHQGETIYIVSITRDASASVAIDKLRSVLPSFGATKNYFVLQKTNAFDGLAPGTFVIFEAYSTHAKAQEGLALWSSLSEPSWFSPQIHRVTVKTSEPIPVVGTDVLKNGGAR